MLTGLGHRAVSSGHHQDGTVHLRRTGDHVLDIVGVAGAVNVRIVALLGLILNVRGVDRDTTGTLFRGLVDVRIIDEFGVALQVQDLGDRGRQRGLAMVNVADGTNVYMGFGSFELCLCHCGFSSFYSHSRDFCILATGKPMVLILSSPHRNFKPFSKEFPVRKREKQSIFLVRTERAEKGRERKPFAPADNQSSFFARLEIICSATLLGSSA